MGFPGGLVSKESTCNAEDLGLIHGLGRSPGTPWQITPVFLLGESPGTEEAGRLHSMELQRFRYDGATKHTYVFSPGAWIQMFL